MKTLRCYKVIHVKGKVATKRLPVQDRTANIDTEDMNVEPIEETLRKVLICTLYGVLRPKSLVLNASRSKLHMQAFFNEVFEHILFLLA